MLHSDRARLEFVLKMINDIEIVVARHKNIENTLNDVEGYHAVMMCLMQIGESLGKIADLHLKELLPSELAYKMRNIIAHDYIGINIKVIISTVNNDLPLLKRQIESILKDES